MMNRIDIITDNGQVKISGENRSQWMFKLYLVRFGDIPWIKFHSKRFEKWFYP